MRPSLARHSLVLLLLLHHILLDCPVELANLVVHLVQVPLNQQLKVRMLSLCPVSIFGIVGIPVEVPAFGQELVEELFLERGSLRICHIFAPLEQFRLGLLGAAQFE